MSRTTQALKRLGVAGLAVVTIGAGVPAFVAGTANAATATGVTLTPETANSGVNTCTAFTATVTPAPTAPDSTTVNVTISQENPAFGSGTNNGPATLTFCDPDAAGAGTTPNIGTAIQDQSTAPGSTTPGAGTTSNGVSCTAPTASSTQSSTTRCNAQFTTTGGTASVTFGVQSNRAGTVNVLAFFDTNGNRTAETFEPQDASTLTVVSGTATSLVCTPESQSAPQGGNADFVCTATAGTVAATGANVRYVVTSGPDNNAGGGTATNTGQCGSVNSTNNAFTTGTSNNQGQVVCRIANISGNLGTNNVTFFVEQNGQPGPQSGEPFDTSTATFTGAARNIDCTPDTQTVQSAGVSTITCTVTDARGNAVAPSTATGNNNPVYVTFTSTGAGRFTTGQTVQTVQVRENGQATIQTTSQLNETGTQTVVAQLSDVNGNNFATAGNAAGAECRSAAGVTGSGVQPAPATAGNCSDTVTRTYTASGSPTPNPTGTATSGPTGTASPTTPATQNPTAPTTKLALTVTGPGTITPGQQGIMRATGQANAEVTLRCYSRPSTEYYDARNASLGEDGSVEFRITPGTNTRCFVKYRGTADNDARNSASVVQNVATALSLSVVRNGTRNYTFQGRILPRRAGQLITLYRVDNTGREVLTAQVRTDDTGTWRINRVFTGRGTFNFIARTGQTLTNVAGRSNVRPTAIF